MNNEKEKPSFFSIIPAYVRYDKEVPYCSKTLYGEITCLVNSEGYCENSNKYFADLYEVDERSIKRWIRFLRKKGYIKCEYQMTNLGKKRKIYLSNNYVQMIKK